MDCSTQHLVSLLGLLGGFAASGSSGFACPQAVGLGAGFEDVGIEGDAVDDRGDQARVGEDGAPLLKGRLVAIALVRSQSSWRAVAGNRQLF